MFARRPYRHLLRYRQVVAVLVRHGFGALVDQLGLTEVLPFGRLLFARSGSPRQSQPERLRLAFEELGATFIKVGQILSTRPDLLPADYITELSKLRDAAAPVPFAAIRQVIEAELHGGVETLFTQLDPTPLASASIGQVHTATLPTGERVVVKVQKPGVAEQIATDLEILADLARVAARRSQIGEQYDLPGLVEEFSWTLLAELDYDREGRNADIFRAHFRTDSRLYVPRIHWEYTTRRVIVLERISGITIDDVAALDRAGIDRRALAHRSAGVILKEVFEDGFFHGDPHPGNFVVLADGTIGAMDFGMVGRLEDKTRGLLFRLLTSVLERDTVRMVDVLDELAVVGRDVPRSQLRRELAHLLDKYYGRPFRELDASEIIASLFAVARRSRLQFPADLSLLLKTIAMNEGVGRLLDPEFNMVEEATPYVRNATLRRFLPTTWGGDMLRAGEDMARLSIEAPARLDRLLRLLERGEFTVSTRSVERERLLEGLNRLVNRLAVSLLAAALIIGLAMILQWYRPPEFNLLAGGLVVLGFLMVTVLGAYLIYSFLRAGR